MTKLKTAKLGASLEARRLATSNQLAAGSVGNLFAQYNDLGVMMAAGQNPIQLALQQGTQISQVLGPLGARGAVKALKAAFVSLVSPINLITIGTIAAGAALFQYATSARGAEKDVDSLKDALAELESQTVDSQQKLALLQTGIASTERLTIQREINRLERERLEVQQLAAIVPLRENEAQGATVQQLDKQIDAWREKLATLDRAEASLAKEQARLNRISNAYRFYVRSRVEGEEIIARKLDNQNSLYVRSRSEAEALSRQLLEAYRAGGDFSGVEMSGGVEAAAAAAAALAQDLGVSLRVAQGMVALSDLAAPGGPDQARAKVRERTNFGQVGENGVIAINRRTAKKPDTGGAERQREAVKNLTQSLRDELAILRETDPIQREIIRNRETLASATEAERATIEGLIREHDAETLAVERKQAAWDLMGRSATGVLDDIFDKSKSLTDVVRNLGTTILDAAIQGQLLGTGPFGGGGGGLIGAIFPSLIPARAEGGPVFGPGGPKDDRVLMWGSNGEFMMNAAATARYRPILEIMNAGGPIGAFANGGPVGGNVSRLLQSANDSRPPLQVAIDVSGARGDREIEEAAYRGMQAAIEEYDRETLPGRVGQINENPRRRG
ncbi:phage tail length tape measure family protein [Roseobacter sp. YSTF-M11]|uniref:Phage tail length tape measure family protein n=2 Tax=Roseobacter insulae TaxID=2859783 RepID=A0A9X1FWG1_9RHOB|nr:phage tail length tape measure family protein [Roseobacter insulae]